MTKRIPIEQLKPGMVIIKVTQQNGPVKIKKSGVVSSDDMVSALSEMGVQEVEIDPDMQAQIKRPKIHKSKTQQLLEDTNNYAQNIDQGLSEQFNRSLFLPSVQELPEAWQYYGKKAAVAGLVVVGGFSIGWVIANMAYLGKWIGNSGNQTSPIAAIEQPITPAPIEEKIENQVPVPEAIPAPEPEIEELDEGQVRKRLAELEKEKLAKLEAERMQQLQEEALQEQAIKAQQDEAPRADISPDLLRRFQDALQDIGEVKPQGPAVDVRPIKDVPPVEELPAWVLTQLPNLSFSAHMYVSEPSERWVRVNGKRVKEGVEIEDGLMLVSIEPQHVIMTFKSQEFSMDALSDW